MPEFVISGIPVNFPFQPYDVQHAYMEKVIRCLQNSTNGILESPTGTGKTLSLLCSSLAWVTLKKGQVQAEAAAMKANLDANNEQLNLNLLISKLNEAGGAQSGRAWGVPKIIYASRTHSQLTQAMQELKSTCYKHMKAIIVGSRDQLCIHPEVMKEDSNANKIQMCKLKVVTRSCIYHRNVEQKKDHADFRESSVMDIEDLVKAGQKHRACPYFMSKELTQNADIIFMPYNYLLDPKARRANNIELTNTIIILDEAHNVEKMCEDSASVQIKSSDVASCIEDVTGIMKAMSKDPDMSLDLDGGDEQSKDFTIDDLALLKEMLLSLEQAIDLIEIKNSKEGVTFGGSYIFDILQKANITTMNYGSVCALVENLIQYLATVSEKNSFVRRGAGLQILSELLAIAFAEVDGAYRDRIHRCFKVHVDLEETKGKSQAVDGWLSKTSAKQSNAKVINYWCFSPGFGMNALLNKNVRSIILTSGTLAPLKPLITELGLPVGERLENPHIVGKSQICVKIVNEGPDREPLNSCFANRNNPKYIASLGRTILSFTMAVPHGMLVFFPSYSILLQCQNSWQASGIWSSIARVKPIYVEPRGKEAFLNAMSEFYANVNDPQMKGAIFMAVCRGKVSEGLDFADNNGRAVLITGLPFPPLLDPRVVLKKKYLQENRTRENEMLTGDEWYVLEASRAVNQAIGRVIRHKDDYGAILLCDTRFNNTRQKEQLSKWIQGHLTTASQNTRIGPLIGEVSRFFRNAERTLPQPGLKPLIPSDICSPVKENSSSVSFAKMIPKHSVGVTIKQENMSGSSHLNTVNYKELGNDYKLEERPKDFMSGLNRHVNSIDFNDTSSYRNSPSTSSNVDGGLVTIHKRDSSNLECSSTSSFLTTQASKKKKMKILTNFGLDLHSTTLSSDDDVAIVNDSVTNVLQHKEVVVNRKQYPTERKEFLKIIRETLHTKEYQMLLVILNEYQIDNDFNKLYAVLESIFNTTERHTILIAMATFIKNPHKSQFAINVSLLKKIN